LEIIKAKSRVKNLKAKESDQAKTPKEIFEIIYKRWGHLNNQFFDPCVFRQNWSHDTHYNGLLESWHGDFVFCNPPYSVGAKFISKGILEFLKGRNVILLVP
jgi:hypothetical protein